MRFQQSFLLHKSHKAPISAVKHPNDGGFYGTGYDSGQTVVHHTQIYPATVSRQYFPAVLQHGRYDHRRRFVGANALAAVGSTGTVMFLIIGFAQGITAGFTILTSQRYGAKDEKAVRASVANGILLSVLVAILITVVGLSTMKPLLLLMNTPEDIFADAYTYSMLICSGVVACIFYKSCFPHFCLGPRQPVRFRCFSLYFPPV